MANKDTLGDRIKSYERVYNQKLTPNSPLFIRVDGKAFHTFTRGLEKPFSQLLIDAMTYAARETAKQMQGFKLAYIQSDEATFLLTDYDTFETNGWFDYKLNKIVSITASLFTAHFNYYWYKNYNRPKPDLALFDARAFTVPKDDIANVFIWRQRDWERNSIQMLGRSEFSQKELHNKSVREINEMFKEARGYGWDDISDVLKYGTFIEADYTLTHNREEYYSLTERIEESLKCE